MIPIKELLSEPDLILDQWLNLDGASPDSQILLRAQLKVEIHLHSTILYIYLVAVGAHLVSQNTILFIF